MEGALDLFDFLFGRKPSDPADDMIRWLSDKSLDDRRIMAGVLYGGPHSLTVLKWVLTRPDCDQGTAAMLLWEFGLPSAIVRADSRFPLDDQVKRELVEFIVERWRAGGFAEPVFGYDPREQAKVYRRELKKKGLKGTDPLSIPEEAWRPIAGRRPMGSEEVTSTTPYFKDGLLGALRLADLAAINPEYWEPLRRKSLGLD